MRDHSLPAIYRAIDAIRVAFDGVPAPGPGETTLYEAEEADSWGCAERDDPPSHRGRWQDLPDRELRDCRHAVGHLDAAGLHYYAPAIMEGYLCWYQYGDDDLWMGIYEFFPWYFTVKEGDDLRDHIRERFERFTAPQRVAIRDFMYAADTSVAERAGWDRAVAHDESGSPNSWFDAFWPARERMASEEALALLLAAFPVDASAPWTALDCTRDDLGHLPPLPPEAFQVRLPAYARYVLEHSTGEVRMRRLSALTSILHPLWTKGAHHDAGRARMAFLTQPMRHAVAAFLDACDENHKRLTLWRQAAVDDRDDWFERLNIER